MSNIKNAYYMAGVEFSQLSLNKQVLLGATVAAVAFDLSPLNEWITGASSSVVNQGLGEVNSTFEIARNTMLAAGVGGVVMTAEQVAVGSITAVALQEFPSSAKVFNEGKISEDNTSLNGSVADTVFLGTSIALGLKHKNESNRSLKDDLKFVAKGAPLVGMYMFGVVGVVGTAINLLDYKGYDTASETLESLATNPLVYFGLYGLAKTFGKIKKHLGRIPEQSSLE
jgi:hypothetical protein